MNRASFQLRDGRELQVKALGGRLQCALEGVWHRGFVRMTFREDGQVELPELPLGPLPLADGDRALLQDLAAFAGIGVRFREVRSGTEVRVSIAEAGLQYTCDGNWRPPFRHLEFGKKGMVMFPEIHHSAKLPDLSLIETLQALSALSGYGVAFPEARGRGCLRMTIAGEGKLQYTVDGRMRPVFSKIFFQDEFLHFPELGTTAKLPKDAARVRREIQELACRASLGVCFEEARGHGRIWVTCADDRLLQYSLEGIERPAFQQMVFLQDDMVNFADIGKLVQLPHSRANELRAKLQDLACQVHLGVKFHTARGTRSVRFHLGHETLQYTVDGSWRPAILQMTFQADGLLNIPELNKTIRMSEKEAEGLRILLQELAALAGLCVSFVEARGNDCIRISLAAEKLLQYTVNGSWRPCFSELHLHEDGWVHFPELGKKAQLPFDQVYTVRSRLLALQKRSQDCEKMEELGWEPGPALWLVVDAGSVQLTACDAPEDPA